LFPELAAYNIMDILGGLALAGTLLDILLGARPVMWQAPVILLVAFLLWTAFTVVASLRWFGGAALALQSLSINLFVFLLTALHGSEMSRNKAIRRAALLALLVTVGMGLRAYYFGHRAQEFVFLQRSSAPSDESSAASGRGMIDRLVGRRDTRTAPPLHVQDPGSDEDESPGHVYSRRLRALGFLNDPNDLAQILVASLPLILLAWHSGRHASNLVFAIAPAAVVLWAILLTRSRGGLVALAALAYLAGVSRLNPRWSRLLKVVGALALLSVLVVFFRISADESARGRLEAWSTGLQLLKQSPIWGVGYASFVDHHDIVAHNSFVHCFAETGLVGYGLWLAVLVSTFSRLQQVGSFGAPDSTNPRQRELIRWSNALRLSLASFLVGALFLSRTYSTSLFFLVGLSAALTGAASRVAPEEQRRPLSVLRLVAVIGGLIVLSIVATYLVVRLGR
jgi:O-antigen ligase